MVFLIVSPKLMTENWFLHVRSRSHSNDAEDSSLLGRDAMFLYKYLLTFQRHHNPSKRQVLLAR